MPKPFERARRNWERRYRLDHHRRQYRSRVLGRVPLPERHPRFAYLFAIVPTLAVVVLLAASPFLWSISKAITNIQAPTATAGGEEPTGVAGEPTDVVSNLPAWDGKERLNFLLVGVDRRDDGELPRTDTIIIITVDPQSKSVGILSLPRDLMVTIPGGYGKDKLNAAFVYGERDKRVGGGIGLLKRTIQENLYIQITHYGMIDFKGFERVVDEFGGVTVDPPYPILDDEYPTENYGYTSLYFPAGVQHLNGHQALQYARTRHADSDFGRSRRQQEVILALREQALGQNLISQASLLTKFFPLLTILGDSVRTDLNQNQMMQLASLALSIPTDSIDSFTIQDLLTDYTDENGVEYVVPRDWAKVRSRMREMIPNAPQVLPTPTADLGLRIGVQNGTVRDRFAARSVERLKAAGFANAVVDEKQPSATLPIPYTIIYDYTGSADTAALIAKTLGVTDPDIRQGTGTAPNGVRILVVLGDDAPDNGPPRVTPTPRVSPTPRAPTPTPTRRP
ncbi:MAG: LCP family protein [Thermomicrobiales bacterium]